MAEVITTQPGSSIDLADTSLKHQDLPEGLNCLETVETLVIVIKNKAKKDKFQICDDEKNPILYPTEVDNCLMEKFCGEMRPFIINIADSKEKGSTTLIKLDRPFRCCLSEIDIMSPPDNTIGSVKQAFSIFIPKYEIYDTRGNLLFTIKPDCILLLMDICFKVYDTDDKEVGEIVKKCSCCDLLKTISTFNIKLPSDMDISNKTLLIGATFLINIVHFEASIMKKLKRIFDDCG